MWAAIVNAFWIGVSGMLLLTAGCLVVYGVWKALDMNEEEKAKRIDPVKETKDLKFTGMSKWESDQTINRLLREDKKRQARKRRYA